MKNTTKPVVIMTAVIGGLAVLFGGMGIQGLGSNNETVALIGAWGTLLVAALTAGMGIYTNSTTVESKDVLEVKSGDTVLAGPANDRLAEGEKVRDLSTPARAADETPFNGDA